jgi:phosphopantetheinyl transferase
MNKLNQVVIIKVELKSITNQDLLNKVAYQLLNFKFPDNFDNWNIKRQITYKIGRTALFSYLDKFLNIKNCEFQFNDYGKPEFKNLDLHLHFNISHTDNFLFIIFAPFSTGIDVETIKVRKNYDLLKNKVLSINEKKFVEHAKDFDEELKRFFWLWTIKETLVKVTGRGLVGLSDFEMLNNEYIAQNVEIDGSIFTYTIENNILSFFLNSQTKLDNVLVFDYKPLLDTFTQLSDDFKLPENIIRVHN